MSAIRAGSAVALAETFSAHVFKTFDPFLFVAYHADRFPPSVSSGNKYADLGPDPDLIRDRKLGNDFSNRDGWSMYMAKEVPGFPNHPHYGFDIISVVRKGLVDHFDNQGNTARYGNGDTLFMTTGSGLQHSEMFPLVNSSEPNPLELIQIWQNVPQAKRRSKPYLKLAWENEQPTKSFGVVGKQAHLKVVTGSLSGLVGVPPPPDSYANEPNSEVVISTITLDPDASFTLPAASSVDINRTIYFLNGSGLAVDSDVFKETVTMVKLHADREVELKGIGSETTEVLLLQGRPINEPLFMKVPFVAGSNEELAATMKDFRRAQYGGWQWERSDMVHPRSQTRFYQINGKRRSPT